jgi:hypothetical protein
MDAGSARAWKVNEDGYFRRPPAGGAGSDRKE